VRERRRLADPRIAPVEEVEDDAGILLKQRLELQRLRTVESREPGVDLHDEAVIFQTELAAAVDSAVDAAIAAAPTRDLGGRASTTEFTAAVLTALPTKEEARR